MVTEVKNTNYWILRSALYIQLNAMGEPDYIQSSVVSGASILCYMSDVPGLGYDAGHNYQRWTLAAYPSIFPDSGKKYIYVAIPRVRTGDNDIATLVFPSQRIDIYGKAIIEQTKEDGSKELVSGDQIGNENFYYIYLQGIISEVKTDTDNTRKREWEQHIDFGSLATDEAIASGGDGSWWKLNTVSDTITFLKTILKANFEELTAKDAKIIKLALNGKDLTGVADNTTLETSNTTVVTPQYLGQFGVKHFLAKDKDDTAHGTITFEKVQNFLQGMNIGDGNNYRIDGNGNAILSSVLVNLLKSLDFNESEQSGFAIKQRSDGKFQMLLTDLIVWGKAIFNTLLIRELSYVGGNIVLSPAAGKINYIKEVYSETTNELIGWKCYLLADDGTTATINSFKVEDQVRCQTFNISPGVYENVSNQNYWRLVTKVSTENETITDAEGNELYDGKKFAWIQIAKDNCMEGSDNPSAGDTIVLMGNRTDKSRQHLLMMETEGDSAPKLTMYRGVNSYTLKDKSIFDVGFDGINIVTKYFKMVNVSGEKIWTPIYLGDWREGTAYEYYNEVTWLGTRWLCIVPEGQTTTEEPSEDSPYWKATTAIQRNKLLIDLRGQDTLDWGETIDVVCSVIRGDSIVDTSSGWDWSVERDSGNKQEDAAWNATSKAQNFKGTINIAFTENENDLGAENKKTFGVVFTFKAWQIANKTNEVSATLSV